MSKAPGKERTRTRVLIVDDHVVLAECLARGINESPDLAVCGMVASPAAALKAADTVRPDVMLVDLSLGGESGLELIKDLHIRHPQMKMLVLSMHSPAIYAERALRSGAHGYVVKDVGLAEVIEAIRKVQGGEIHLPEGIMQDLVTRLANAPTNRAPSPIGKLTDRELEVLRLIGRGMSSNTIAGHLHRSSKTVETHRTHIREKLGLESSEELLKYAIEWVRSEQA